MIIKFESVDGTFVNVDSDKISHLTKRDSGFGQTYCNIVLPDGCSLEISEEEYGRILGIISAI